MTLRSAYTRQLESLDSQINDMALVVEGAYERACGAASGAEDAKGWAIEPAAGEIAAAERGIETLALRLLLLQQPAATDMRRVSSALKMVTDLKRIGDLSIDACRLVTEMDALPAQARDGVFEQLSTHVGGMVRNAIAAYQAADVDAALKVAASDDEADRLFVEQRDAIVAGLVDGNMDAQTAVDLLMVAKCFERIGDHAEKLARWTEYLALGTMDGEPVTFDA